MAIYCNDSFKISIMCKSTQFLELLSTTLQCCNNALYLLPLDDMNAVSNQRTCHLQMVACTTAAPPFCHYLWKDLLNNTEISHKRELNLKYVRGKLYIYPCQIICNINGKNRAFDSDTVSCSG